jgi:hypothetical protein
VIVHSREADEETAEFLAGFLGRRPALLLVAGLLPAALDRGYYVVRWQRHVSEAVELRGGRADPQDRLLAETDCPYLAPQPVRGRRANRPTSSIPSPRSPGAREGRDEAAASGERRRRVQALVSVRAKKNRTLPRRRGTSSGVSASSRWLADGDVVLEIGPISVC